MPRGCFRGSFKTSSFKMHIGELAGSPTIQIRHSEPIPTHPNRLLSDHLGDVNGWGTGLPTAIQKWILSIRNMRILEDPGCRIEKLLASTLRPVCKHNLLVAYSCVCQTTWQICMWIDGLAEYGFKMHWCGLPCRGIGSFPFDDSMATITQQNSPWFTPHLLYFGSWILSSPSYWSNKNVQNVAMWI